MARALAVVGDRWTMLLVREALLGTRRFEDFQANTGASRALVAERLRSLVDEGVSTACGTRSGLSASSTG